MAEYQSFFFTFIWSNTSVDLIFLFQSEILSSCICNKIVKCAFYKISKKKINKKSMVLVQEPFEYSKKKIKNVIQ